MHAYLQRGWCDIRMRTYKEVGVNMCYYMHAFNSILACNWLHKMTCMVIHRTDGLVGLPQVFKQMIFVHTQMQCSYKYKLNVNMYFN